MAKDETPLLEVLKGQWTSMIGMAGMFTVTIFLSTLIQPFYDRDELRAFGTAGSTKLGFILVEGVFILIFTAAIIWLAKKNMQKFIQIGILFVLWIALSYSLVPMAHLAIPTAELTTTTSETQSGGQIMQGLGDTDSIIFFDGDNLVSVDDAIGSEGTYAGGSINWTANISQTRNESVSINQNGEMVYQIMSSSNDFVICDMTQWIRIDSTNGEVVNRFDDNCNLGFVDNQGIEWHIFGPSLMKVDEFKPVESIDSPRDKSWEWLNSAKYSHFIYEVFGSFSRYSHQMSEIAKIDTGIQVKSMMAALFNISERWQHRTRGEDQKLTYRTNRFEETIGSIQYKLNNSAADLGHDLLWVVDLHQIVDDIVPYGNRGYYLNKFLITAKNKQEALSLTETMIGCPLGASRAPHASRVLGHPNFYDSKGHNLRQLSIMTETFDKAILDAEERLKQVRENKEKVSYISAIVSQAGLMINGTI